MVGLYSQLDFFIKLLSLEALDLGGAPLRYSEVQGPFLSAKLLFVRIAAADVKLPGYNQRVSSSIFKVMLTIELVETYVETSLKASSERLTIQKVLGEVSGTV